MILLEGVGLSGFLYGLLQPSIWLRVFCWRQVDTWFLLPELLAAYCVVTSVFHFIPSDGWQMSIFIKNWAIAGGLLALSAAHSRTIADR